MKQIDLKKHKYWLSLLGIWVLGFVVVAVCYVTLHLPRKHMLIQINNQANESRDMLMIAQRATSPEIHREIEQELDRTEQAVHHFSVPRPNTTALVFEIGKIANDLGLSDFASKNQPLRDIPTIRDSKTVSEDWLKVEFQASFSDFAQFVNRLERQNPAVFVERLTLRRGEDGQLDHNVIMELSFLVTQDDNPLAMADGQAEEIERQ
jgi:hypothetical protein